MSAQAARYVGLSACLLSCLLSQVESNFIYKALIHNTTLCYLHIVLCYYRPAKATDRIFFCFCQSNLMVAADFLIYTYSIYIYTVYTHVHIYSINSFDTIFSCRVSGLISSILCPGSEQGDIVWCLAFLGTLCREPIFKVKKCSQCGRERGHWRSKLVIHDAFMKGWQNATAYKLT